MTEENLPTPPVPADLDLRHFDCMHLDVKRLLNSDLIEDCNGEEVKAALLLWARCWHQVPASSLPNDEKKLAKWAGLGGDLRRWKSVRSGALRGYTLATDGRLYHHVIAEIALKAFAKSRAGKRGAQVKHATPKPLKTNDTEPKVPLSSHDGRPDGTDDGIYSVNASGKPADKSLQRREGSNLTPLPPSLPSAGSGCADAPPARPPHRPKPTMSNDHGVELADGRVCVHHPTPAEPGKKPQRILWIADSGNIDMVELEFDLPPLKINLDEARALRLKALESRDEPDIPAGQRRMTS